MIERNVTASPAPSAAKTQVTTLETMPDVLTMSEAMQILRLSRGAVMGLIERGEIAARKTCPGKGGRWLVPRSSVEAYLGLPRDAGPRG